MEPLSPEFLDFLRRQEGFVPKAQWDYKQYTNGYGTRATAPGETIDQATADARLRDEAGKAHTFVQTVAPDAPPGVRAALTDLTFNAGQGWANAGLGAAVKAGDYDKARELFLQYNKAGDKELPVLVARRQAGATWFSGNPVGSPQAPANPQGILAQAPAQTAPAASPGGLLSQPQGNPNQLAGLLANLGQQQLQPPAQLPAPQPIRFPVPPGLAALAHRINPYG